MSQTLNLKFCDPAVAHSAKLPFKLPIFLAYAARARLFGFVLNKALAHTLLLISHSCGGIWTAKRVKAPSSHPDSEVVQAFVLDVHIQFFFLPPNAGLLLACEHYQWCFDCNIMLLFTMFVKEKRYYQLFVQHTPLLYPDHVLSLLFDNETRAVRYDHIPI